MDWITWVVLGGGAVMLFAVVWTALVRHADPTYPGQVARLKATQNQSGGDVPNGSPEPSAQGRKWTRRAWRVVFTVVVLSVCSAGLRYCYQSYTIDNRLHDAEHQFGIVAKGEATLFARVVGFRTIEAKIRLANSTSSRSVGDRMATRAAGIIADATRASTKWTIQLEVYDPSGQSIYEKSVGGR